MNERFKFRAWDGERLRSVNTIGWTNGELDWLDTPKYHGPIDEDIKLMQFTGLKDKNDVEIYEGDIVRWHDVVTNDYTVTFIDGVFCIDEMASSNFYHLSDDIGTKWEVIGNIYENPELLEASK